MAPYGRINLYFDNNGNGKTYDGDSDNNRELDEMTYWSLEGADKAWWRSDLKTTLMTKSQYDKLESYKGTMLK